PPFEMQALFCGGMKGEAQHVCNPDRPSAIFLPGRVYHWGHNRGCEPAQLIALHTSRPADRNHRARARLSLIWTPRFLRAESSALCTVRLRDTSLTGSLTKTSPALHGTRSQKQTIEK